MTYEEAIHSGETRFDGVPCKRCGSTLRRVKNRGCIKCGDEANKRYRSTPEFKAKAAANKKRYRASEHGKAKIRAHKRSPESLAKRKAYIQSERYKALTIKHRLMKKYGLTEEAYESLLRSQGGKCAICSIPYDQTKRLCVDHDHTCCPGEYSCGKCIRGLLCHACNLVIGNAKDDVQRLRSAISYLVSNSINTPMNVRVEAA